MSEIQRYDPVLATDVCGNKDVVMRERVDGIFMRYDDHAAALRERDERIAALEAENSELVRKHNEQFKAAAQLAEVVVKLNAENARLSAPVTDAEWACVNYQQGFSTGILSTKEGEHTVMNWQQFTTRELIDALLAARKGAA